MGHLVTKQTGSGRKGCNLFDPSLALFISFQQDLSMKTKNKRFPFLLSGLLFCGLSFFVGCGSKDVAQMEAGLIKSGMPADQAECFAREMGETVKADPYNYMAKLMNAGADEKSAINKARRKYGADFKAPMESARDACFE
ncbi:MAG: hypothetical protein ACI9JZ_001902 [Lentimonas sp.]